MQIELVSSYRSLSFYSDHVSYLELWKLVDETDLATVNDIVSKLVGDSEKNLGKEDLYRRLCEWKEGSSANVRSLYRVMVKLGLHDDLRRIKGINLYLFIQIIILFLRIFYIPFYGILKKLSTKMLRDYMKTNEGGAINYPFHL